VVLATGATSGDLVTTESFFVSSVLNAIPATNGAVTTPYILDGAVTQAKLAAGVAGNGPSFFAYKTSNQSISGGVSTKVTFDTELYDTNNNFASSTFTPTVAGYYQFNVTLSISTPPSNTYVSPILYRNGAAYMSGTQANIFTTSYGGCGFSNIVYLNGSTDYIEIYTTIGQSTNVYGQALPAYSFFSASLIRAA
jgi:hypothetical protein